MPGQKKYDSEMKRQNKEKFILMYDRIFRGEDLTSNSFWNELFLIKPVISHIQNEIMQVNEDSLLNCKQNIRSLIFYSINTLKDKSIYCILYSLQTLSTILFALYRKKYSSIETSISNSIILGLKDSEENLNALVQYMSILLKGEYPSTLKSWCIKLLLVITTGTDNINQNILIGHIISSSIFEALLQILRNSDLRNQYGYNVVLILTLLVNYKKHENANSFIVKLSILDDELALNGYGQVIFNVLSTFCKEFSRFKSDTQVSWLVSLTNIIGSMFVDDEEAKYRKIRNNNSLVLALYEITHLNRNFITTLAYTQSDTSTTAYTNNTLSLNPMPLELQVTDITSQPFNLLAIFFQYCSIVIQSTCTESIIHNVKLCFLILSCISEDEYANSLMHDANIVFRVQLHKMPMYHRKLKLTTAVSQPLAATLLDLMVEFITSHMMKKFPLELYHYCVGILLRILCYQKRCRIRLVFQWINLWTVLINLLKFISSHETHLVKKMNIFSLATEVVNIFNIFITYGDMFLSSPNTYDELFYEIIRMELIFLNLNTMGLRYSTIESYEFKDSAAKLTNALLNMREILNYFPAKISEWLSKQNITTPTETQIMEIIIKNYDNLTLKLQDNLDQFERYSENPKHIEFLNNLVECIIINTRTSISIISIDADAIPEDYTIDA